MFHASNEIAKRKKLYDESNSNIVLAKFNHYQTFIYDLMKVQPTITEEDIYSASLFSVLNRVKHLKVQNLVELNANLIQQEQQKSKK